MKKLIACRRVEVCVVIIAMAMMADIARANITPTRISGGLELSGSDWSMIRMVSEEIWLDVTPAHFSVTGTYEMYNPTDSESVEEIGYPYDYRYKHELNNFHAWVDGKEVAVRDGKRDDSLESRLEARSRARELPRKESKQPQKEKLPQAIVSKIAAGTTPTMEAWKLWKAVLAAKANSTIKIKYDNLPRPRDLDGFAEAVQLRIDDSSFSSSDATEIALANGDTIEAKYILWTGSRWSGRIGKALIHANVHTPPGWKVAFAPAPSSCERDRTTWRFNNFKPPQGDKGEIVIRFTPPRLDSMKRAKIYKAIAEKHPRSFYFVRQAADKIEELGDAEGANVVRLHSARVWCKDDTKYVMTTTDSMAYEADPVLDMSWHALKYFDTTHNTDCAISAANVFGSVFKEGLKHEHLEHRDTNLGVWPKTNEQKGISKLFVYMKDSFFDKNTQNTLENYASVRALLSKYGCEIESQ